MKMDKGQVLSVHIYVISLSDELARRQSVCRQLENINVSWSFVDAIDARAVDTSAMWGEGRLAEAQARYGRNFTPGEIACAESHYQVWRTLAQNDVDIGIILEDDFIASPKFFELLSELGQACPDWFDLLFFGYSKLTPAAQTTIYRFMPIHTEQCLAGVRIGPAWREWTYGNVAYAVTRKAAAKIIAAPRLFSLADDWVTMKIHYQLRIRHVRPLLVQENFEVFPSALDSDRAHLLKPYYKWLDFARYLRGYLGLWIMKLRAWRE